MNDLQTGLALLGAALIAGIFVFSRIQEYRYRRMAEQALPERGHDPLMDDGGTVVTLRSEPGLLHESSSPEGLSQSVPGDPAVEFVVVLRGGHPASAADLWQALIGSAVTTRNVRWAGWDAASGRWFEIAGASDHHFDAFAAKLQLVSRSGPVNEARLTLFSDEMRHVAQQLHVEAEAGDMAAAMAAAGVLDRFCAQVDVLIGLNVMFAEGSEPTARQLRDRLEAEGMQLEDDGVFHARASGPADRFTLAHRDALPFLDIDVDLTPVPGVTFLLDVPRTQDGQAALRDMFAMAERQALALGGRVLDDNGAALGLRQLAAIEKQLAGILQQMDRQGVPAGGALAMRLFSH